jgi:hypothetical protein
MSVLRLLASVSGPTGLTLIVEGEDAIIVTTSWSRDLDSFLSMPASLPEENATSERGGSEG